MYLKTAPRIDFDPANKEHRHAAALFMQRNAWADSPIKFTHDPDYDNVANQVRQKLLHWYMARDLGRVEITMPINGVSTKKLTLVAEDLKVA